MTPITKEESDYVLIILFQTISIGKSENISPLNLLNDNFFEAQEYNATSTRVFERLIEQDAIARLDIDMLKRFKAALDYYINHCKHVYINMFSANRYAQAPGFREPITIKELYERGAKFTTSLLDKFIPKKTWTRKTTCASLSPAEENILFNLIRLFIQSLYMHHHQDGKAVDLFSLLKTEYENTSKAIWLDVMPASIWHNYIEQAKATDIRLTAIIKHLTVIGETLEGYHKIKKDDLASIILRIKSLRKLLLMLAIISKHLYAGSSQKPPLAFDCLIGLMWIRCINKIRYLIALGKFLDDQNLMLGSITNRSARLFQHFFPRFVLDEKQSNASTELRVQIEDYLEAHGPAHIPWNIDMRFAERRIQENNLDVRSYIGFVARMIFVNWLTAIARDPETPCFLLWLENTPYCCESQDVEKNPLLGPTYRSGVTYYTKEENQTHLLTIDNGLFKTAKKAVFDTTQLIPTKSIIYKGFSTFVFDRTQLIFAGPHEISRYHHASYASGSSIICAGMLKIEAGRLLSISNDSGHYKAGTIRLYYFCLYLQESGIDMSTVTIIDESRDRQMYAGIGDFEAAVVKYKREIYGNTILAEKLQKFIITITPHVEACITMMKSESTSGRSSAFSSSSDPSPSTRLSTLSASIAAGTTPETYYTRHEARMKAIFTEIQGEVDILMGNLAVFYRANTRNINEVEQEQQQVIIDVIKAFGKSYFNREMEITAEKIPTYQFYAKKLLNYVQHYLNIGKARRIYLSAFECNASLNEADDDTSSSSSESSSPNSSVNIPGVREQRRSQHSQEHSSIHSLTSGDPNEHLDTALHIVHKSKEPSELEKKRHRLLAQELFIIATRHALAENAYPLYQEELQKYIAKIITDIKDKYLISAEQMTKLNQTTDSIKPYWQKLFSIAKEAVRLIISAYTSDLETSHVDKSFHVGGFSNASNSFMDASPPPRGGPPLPWSPIRDRNGDSD